MRALMYQGRGHFELVELEDPLPGDGEVVVDVSCCGICGSDLLAWYADAKAPAVLGHEIAGVASAVGKPLPGKPTFEVGQRVFVHHHVPCQRCELCRRGYDTLCPDFSSSNVSPGGFAERVLVPAEIAAADLLPIPPSLDDRTATLIEPLACCERGVRIAAIGPGSRVVIVGLGPMGQLYARSAAAAGASVVGIDPIEFRRGCAESVCRAVCEPSAEAARSACDGLVPSHVILCAGPPQAFELAFEIAGKGTLVQAFAPADPGARLPAEINSLFFDEITFQSTYSCGPRDTRAALARLVDGSVSAAGVLTHAVPLADGARAMKLAKQGEEAVKVVLEMRR